MVLCCFILSFGAVMFIIIYFASVLYVMVRFRGGYVV